MSSWKERYNNELHCVDRRVIHFITYKMHLDVLSKEEKTHHLDRRRILALFSHPAVSSHLYRSLSPDQKTKKEKEANLS